MSSGEPRVGLFGGSFDPIHFGHLNLSISLMEAHRLDRVIFCPAGTSPFKGAAPPKAGKEHRKKMLSLAIEPIKAFSLLDVELNREGLSYTIDTIKDVINDSKQKKRQESFFLMLGEDALHHFHLWKSVEEIIHLAPPLIGTRIIENVPTLDKLPLLFQEVIRQGMTRVPVMQISSTVIRNRLSKRLYCGHLVPAPVLEYIESHQLYLE